MGLTWGRRWDRSDAHASSPEQCRRLSGCCSRSAPWPAASRSEASRRNSGSRRCSASKPVVAKASARSTVSEAGVVRCGNCRSWPCRGPARVTADIRRHHAAPTPPATTRRPPPRRFHPAKAERQPRRARRAGEDDHPGQLGCTTLRAPRPAHPRRRTGRLRSTAPPEPGALEDPGQGEPGGGAGAEPRRDPGRYSPGASQGRRPHPASARVCSMAA